MKILIILMIMVISLFLPFNSLHTNTDTSIADTGETVANEIEDEQVIGSTENDNSQAIEEGEEIIEVISPSAYIKSKVEGLSVRTKPSLNSSVIGRLDKGDMVAYLGKEGNWYITIYKNQTAYVSANVIYTSMEQFAESNEQIECVIQIGEGLLGYPYVWGAIRVHSGSGTLYPNFDDTKYDCSSLVQYAYFKGAGVMLNMTTRTQIYNGEKVNKSDLKRGDLLFFTNSSRYYNTGIERIGHVGIYLGNNYILHTSSDHAVIEPISTYRWNNYIDARRVI